MSEEKFYYRYGEKVVGVFDGLELVLRGEVDEIEPAVEKLHDIIKKGLGPQWIEAVKSGDIEI